MYVASKVLSMQPQTTYAACSVLHFPTETDSRWLQETGTGNDEATSRTGVKLVKR